MTYDEWKKANSFTKSRNPRLKADIVSEKMNIDEMRTAYRAKKAKINEKPVNSAFSKEFRAKYGIKKEKEPTEKPLKIPGSVPNPNAVFKSKKSKERIGALINGLPLPQIEDDGMTKVKGSKTTTLEFLEAVNKVSESIENDEEMWDDDWIEEDGDDLEWD